MRDGGTVFLTSLISGLQLCARALPGWVHDWLLRGTSTARYPRVAGRSGRHGRQPEFCATAARRQDAPSRTLSSVRCRLAFNGGAFYLIHGQPTSGNNANRAAIRGLTVLKPRVVTGSALQGVQQGGLKRDQPGHATVPVPTHNRRSRMTNSSQTHSKSPYLTTPFIERGVRPFFNLTAHTQLASATKPESAQLQHPHERPHSSRLNKSPLKPE